MISYIMKEKSVTSTPVCSEDNTSMTGNSKEESKEKQRLPGVEKISSNHEEKSGPPKQDLLDPINLCEWSVDQARRHPILGRAVTPCFVDMVRLPGIFLQHPSVLVEESENEMVISDYFTEEFIAKKIIYD